MSKLVTQRFEYVCYDDAQLVTSGSGVVSSYPQATEQYSNNATASAGTSYGSAAITTASGGAVSTINVPAGATITMIGASSNTVLCTVYVTSVQLVPGGSTIAQMNFPVAPNQIVTLPGQFNNGTLNVQSQSSNMAVAGNVGTVTLLWSV